jgi:hypothetical protein
MTDTRGQASVTLAAALALSIVLSALVAGAVTQTGTTTDFNLNENSNDGVLTPEPTPESTPEPTPEPTPDPGDQRAISFAALCVVAGDVDESDVVDITFSNPKPGEPGEFLTASFNTTVPVDYVVLKYATTAEEFAFDLGGVTSGSATVGDGVAVDRPANDPCRAGDAGVKKEVDGGAFEAV